MYSDILNSPEKNRKQTGSPYKYDSSYLKNIQKENDNLLS
jgi:hypothetical protein